MDEILPPALRDRRWLVAGPARLLYGSRAGLYLDFKSWAPGATKQQFAEAYRVARGITYGRETDTNRACLAAIEHESTGLSLLDAGCGRAVVARRLGDRLAATASDIIVDDDLPRRHPNVRFCVAPVEALPFEDGEFDTVVCSHTLEHVRDLGAAVRELRRVCARRLIVIVPMQRPYRYTFDLHLQFFPYPHALLAAIPDDGAPRRCEELDGDLFYVEERG